MVGPSELLARAAKEVQLADHLLTVTYPFAGEVKVLFRVMYHAVRAVHNTVRAIVPQQQDVYGALLEMDIGKHVAETYKRFRNLLSAQDTAPVVFTRNESYVIADEGFSQLREVRHDDVARGMQAVKEFVFQAGKQVLVA